MVFRVNKPSGLHGDGMTQFGRALKARSIKIICANSSQAKGRVERANKALQDRLAKKLRLAGISPDFSLTTTPASPSPPPTPRICTGP